MESTVAAVSTAMSESGIGIVRMSGPGSMEIISKIYRPKNKKKNILNVPTHTIHYGYIYDQDELVDEVLVMIMKKPHTYTGEDVVEIDCHGGIFSVKKILDTVLKYGAEPAGPGEFTKRAFLNGRLDLSQAEAVMDIIQAKNNYALKSSMEQLRGSVKNEIQEIREKILYQTAYIESALDDPEHISLDGYRDQLKAEVIKIRSRIRKLLNSFSDGKIIREGIKTVILGKPNAGKSSLMNLLLGENRAIVTDIAGTTRDILNEYINLQGITLQLIDTAGIRMTEDVIEKIGVEKARETAQEADLILYVVDSSAPLDDNDHEIIKLLENRKGIVIYNKTDLQPVVDLQSLKDSVQKPVVPVSAKEGTGIGDLEKEIKELFFGGELSFNDEVYITNARHKTALQNAEESLILVLESIENEMPEDFFSIDLTSAYESLGEIIGESIGEDLVNKIFESFCIGK